jgi:Protein of unknown function (DUF3102)
MTATTTRTKRATSKKGTGEKKASTRKDPNEPKKDLSELAQQIQAGHRLCLDSVRSTIDKAAETGQLLIRAREEVKKKVGHGGWQAWLRKECEISVRVAQNDMRIARNHKQIEKQVNRQEDLTIRQALWLIGGKAGADRLGQEAKAPPPEFFRVTAAARSAGRKHPAEGSRIRNLCRSPHGLQSSRGAFTTSRRSSVLSGTVTLPRNRNC